MEFKGTKGKWIVGGKETDGIYVSSIHPQNRDICTVWLYYTCFLEHQEAKANALLISKAPEMLEMLQKIVLMTDVCEGTFKDFRERYNLEIKQLIKEATEI